MSASENPWFSAATFSGKVRLLALPNHVLLPHVAQPLHVVEPRDCALLEDALADDHLLALAVMQPGWEADYEGSPPIGPIACLAKILACQPLPHGFNVLLMGLRRVRLLREREPIGGFREAEAELCVDHYPPQFAAQRAALHAQLREAFLRVLPLLPQAQTELEELLRSEVSLGVLTDVIGYGLDLGLRRKEELLRQTDVDRRARLLLDHLASLAEQEPGYTRGKPFPPDFSGN